MEIKQNTTQIACKIQIFNNWRILIIGGFGSGKERQLNLINH